MCIFTAFVYGSHAEPQSLLKNFGNRTVMTRNCVTMHAMVQLTSQLLSASPNATISCAIIHKNASCIQPTGRVEPPQNSQAVYLNICSSLQNSSGRTIYIIQCRWDRPVSTVARLWAGQSRD